MRRCLGGGVGAIGGCGRMHVHVCTLACGIRGQDRMTSSITSPSYFLRWDPSLNVNLTDLARLAVSEL